MLKNKWHFWADHLTKMCAGRGKSLADFFHSVPSRPTSGKCRMADFCRLENFSTFGYEIGQQFLRQKTLLSLQATAQHQITTAKRALGYQTRFLGDLVHSEMVRDMVGHSGPSFLSTSEVRFWENSSPAELRGKGIHPFKIYLSSVETKSGNDAIGKKWCRSGIGEQAFHCISICIWN